MMINTQHKVTMLSVIVAALLISVFQPDHAAAAINGICADCHTMHNSQGGAPMNFDNSPAPNDTLLRSTCYGCHAQGGGTPTVSLATDVIPQVLHTGANDLAGGNFAYITGDKGPGDDNRGHNIDDLTGIDDVLARAPGLYLNPHDGVLTTDRLRCTTVMNAAGTSAIFIGCHGYRNQDTSQLPDGITGSHHANVDGQLTAPTEPGDSYRFLLGIRGYEDPDWEENPSSTVHNEYYGLTVPIQYNSCGTNSCHTSPEGVQAQDGTMSQFCATCHGEFHTLATSGAGGTEGVGDDAISPFVRHPTDLALKASGEYAAYTVYSVEAPVARTTLAALSGPSGTVTPGTDAVMCLSCHRAHASNWPDMLRWDYSNMVVGSGNSGGCFTCHTTKN